MRVHTYAPGEGDAVTHADAEPDTRLGDLFELSIGEHVYRVGDDVEIDIDLTLVKVLGEQPGHLIAHRCRQIAVLVGYAGATKPLHAHPSDRVRDIRRKAIAALGLDQASAADLSLRLHGSTADLNPASPIGSYAAHCEVSVDLVHVVRPQG